jgi:tetratricopeptide (TPR) repeat protein
VLRRLGRGDELIARLERLRGGDPDNAVLTRFLAQQYLEANRLDQAAKLYESLAKKEPDSQILAALLKIYRKQGKITSLLRGLGQAVGRSASLDGLGGQVGAITSDAVLLDKLFAEASKRFAAGPGSLGPYAPLAVALLAGEAKRNDLVESFFESAILAAPEHVNDTFLLWGGSLMAKDQFAKAAKVFRRGAMSRISDNDKAMFYYYLASALELGGQTDEALKAARKAQKLSHHSPLLASHEAWVLYHAGRTGEAGEAYERVIDRFRHNHTSPGIRQILREARFILSHLEIERGDKQRAAEWLEEVLDEFPNDISAMNDLGYLWADQGIHTQRALRMIRRAADAEPDNPAYQDSLGWALYRVGRLQEAVIVLEKAAAMLPDGEVYDHLGEVYLKLGKTRDAADTWCKSIEAYRSADQPENAKTLEEKLRKIDPNRGHAGAMEKTKSP